MQPEPTMPWCEAVEAGDNALFFIPEWDERCENNRSREIRKAAWFPQPNDTGSREYIRLVSHPNGVRDFGVLTIIRMIASRGTLRGYLIEGGQPLSLSDIALMAHIDADVVIEAARRLFDLGLLSAMPLSSKLQHEEKPTARTTRKPKSSGGEHAA